jgi:hypothetical protein
MGQVLSIALFVILALTPVMARADDDAVSCRSFVGDNAVAACSRLIESGWYKYRPKDLAVLYSNRSAALSWNGDTDNRSLRRRSPQPRTLHGLVLMKKSKVLPGEARSRMSIRVLATAEINIAIGLFFSIG